MAQSLRHSGKGRADRPHPAFEIDAAHHLEASTVSRESS
jgi:hypothetical protein